MSLLITLVRYSDGLESTESTRDLTPAGVKHGTEEGRKKVPCEGMQSSDDCTEVADSPQSSHSTPSPVQDEPPWELSESSLPNPSTRIRRA